jgi:hypothetical protein
MGSDRLFKTGLGRTDVRKMDSKAAFCALQGRRPPTKFRTSEHMAYQRRRPMLPPTHPPADIVILRIG